MKRLADRPSAATVVGCHSRRRHSERRAMTLVAVGWRWRSLIRRVWWPAAEMIPHRLIPLAVMACASAALAVELRVVAINVLDGVGAPGSAEFNALKELLARLDPDVIGFAEVEANNTNPSNAQYFSDLRALLSELGFATTRQFMATAGDSFATQTFSAGDFGNSTQSLALASRFPIVRTEQISRGISGRKEMTRFPLFVQVDVPGTANDPSFVVVHLKASDTLADRFRKAVEARRINEFLFASGLNGTAHNLFVIGDFNEEIDEPQPASFTTSGVTGGMMFSDGSTLPQTYQLGSGLPETLPYAAFPNSAFASLSLGALPATQADGESGRTFNATGNARLDYILTGPLTTAAGSIFTEVYNSRLEHAFDGLPKGPSLPNPALAELASDHFAIIADVALDPLPGIDLFFPGSPDPTRPRLWDSGAPITARVIVEQAPAADLMVVLSRFRTPSPALIEVPPAVTIPAGQTSVEFPVAAGGLLDPGSDRTITLTASAAGYRLDHAGIKFRRTLPTTSVIISQYTEPATGSAPKAIEVLNVSGREIDFIKEPLRVFRYADGATEPVDEARIDRGKLSPAGVMVIGEKATGDYLVGQGLLAAPGDFDSFPNGWVFTDAQGHVLFVKDSFTYNGDDALELQLNFTRADVFGTVGNDPGAAWSRSGVSTEGQNLVRKTWARVGFSGFVYPDIPFQTSSGPTHLENFGVAPAVEPYADWAAMAGLTDVNAAPLADPDANGLANAFEFALGGQPPAWQSSGAAAQLAVIARRWLGSVSLDIEQSPDLRSWSVLQTIEGGTPGATGFQTILIPPVAPENYYRLSARGP
jgi:endonuclease/exonuclease/phosphatase family metal-dependent hydrolase